jgi:hypothetical protein
MRIATINYKGRPDNVTLLLLLLLYLLLYLLQLLQLLLAMFMVGAPVLSIPLHHHHLLQLLLLPWLLVLPLQSMRCCPLYHHLLLLQKLCQRCCCRSRLHPKHEGAVTATSAGAVNCPAHWRPTGTFAAAVFII